MSGCTPLEEEQTLTDVQAALSQLTQNRAMAEQFGRDIKTNVSPSTTTYADLMESYEEARDSYNHFLNAVESDGMGRASQDVVTPSMTDAQNATYDFIEAASKTLNPGGDVRGVSIRRAIKMPVNLPAQLQRIPKAERRRLVKQFGEQVQWRSWGQL
jgi:hypothetical protein